MTPVPHELPFVGRETALGALVSAVQAAELGERVLGLVAGEPGIGKTRLVTEMAARVSSRVLWGGCWEGEGAPPYWVWRQLLRALDAGETLMGEAASADATSDARFRMFDAVADVFATASRHQPLVLVLEDLHWADEGSVRLLEFLARDQRPRRLAMIGTFRDTDLDPASPLGRRLGDLVREGVQLSLGGLGKRDIGRLLEALGEERPEASVPLLHRKSGGNPLFLRELVRLWRDEGGLDGTVPGGLRPVVARRLAMLAPGTRRVLDVAAVVGADFEVTLLSAVTEADSDEVLGHLDLAQTAGLVSSGSSTGSAANFSFVHALVREVLYQELSLAERVALHRRIAAAMEQRDGDARLPQIAHHVLQGAVGGGDQRALDLAVRVAERSFALLAYEEAAGWYGRALEVARADPDGDERRAELLIRRGEASLAAGDMAGARAAYQEAAAVARRRRNAGQLARAALGLGAGFAGFEVQLLDPVQVELLEEALSALDPEPSRLRACVLARLSVALSFMDAEERRLALGQQAVAMARLVDDRSVLGYALAAHVDAIPGPEHTETRLAEAAEVVTLAQAAGDRPLELLGRRLRLVALLEMGDVGEADVEIERFAQVADQVRQPLYRWYVPLWRGMRLLMRRDVAAAARQCAIAEEIGGLAQSVNARYLTFTQWWVRQRYEGKFREAGRAMAELIEPPAGEPATTPAGWPYAAIVAAQLGELDRARALLDEWLHAGLERRTRDSEWLPESAQLAEVAVLAGCQGAAALLYDQLRPYSHRFCVEGIGAAFTGSVSWYLALLARFLGRPEAGDYDREARAAHRRVGLVDGPPPLAEEGATPAATEPEPAPPPAAMVHEGATWAVTFGGSTRRLPAGKGVRDLAVLLARPGEDVHCLELVGGADVGGDSGPVVDQQARRAYEGRIRDLQHEIDEAHADNDPVRADRAEIELDALVQQLSEAFGLAGRARSTGSAAERARSAVGWRIRAAIRHATEAHPAFGRHLQNSVRTGTWCSYRPETPVVWEIDGAGDQGRRA